MSNSVITIKRGLDLPIAGAPEQVVDGLKPVRTVALMGPDYVGMKPSMQVAVGDLVKKGQVLFVDKKTPGVKYTAPAAGRVAAINRGEKRIFHSLVIELEGNEEVQFQPLTGSQLASVDQAVIRDILVESGMWIAFRTRPFSKVPAPDTVPASIFINLMDTNPLAANPEVVIQGEEAFLQIGIRAIARLAPKVFIATAPGYAVEDLPANVSVTAFAGPHPAGLAGTHVHHLDPVSSLKTVWTINYQDVLAIGKLFHTGRLSNERVVSLAGPVVNKPRLVKTLIGAKLSDLVVGEMSSGENRVISGSVLSGRTATGSVDFLGRYHNQVSVIAEGRERKLLHYLAPGGDRYSVLRVFLSQFRPSRKFAFTSTTNGSERAMVPVGTYEKIMPLDILPTHLLRYLIVGDIDMAIKLGALELDEEDLALCTYVCPGKYEYGPILRDNLTRIEKEG